jgi:hypothetical protein
MGNFISDI